MNGQTTAASSGDQTLDRESDGPSPGVSARVDVLTGLACAFSQRLHDADMPVTPAQSVQYAAALHLATPVSRRRLYFVTRAIFVTDLEQVATFNGVFAEIFGARGKTEDDDFDVDLQPALPATYL
jgi:uncharacterized protein with von Willebrand factor type A (vWA) domain